MSDDEDTTVKKLVALSVLAVFKDILPSYRIREEDEEKETGVKLSKDVRKLREYELTMLAYYLRYLQTLEQYISSTSSALRNRPSAIVFSF
jgi:nucleolar complex protein 3